MSPDKLCLACLSPYHQTLKSSKRPLCPRVPLVLLQCGAGANPARNTSARGRCHLLLKQTALGVWRCLVPQPPNPTRHRVLRVSKWSEMTFSSTQPLSSPSRTGRQHFSLLEEREDLIVFGEPLTFRLLKSRTKERRCLAPPSVREGREPRHRAEPSGLPGISGQ